MLSQVRAAARKAGQSAILFLLSLRAKDMPVTSSKLLVVAPHQDDETLACGGIIALKRKRGIAVKVVFVTDGRASHRGQPFVSETELQVLRRQEACAALAKLGVETGDITFIDLPDQGLENLPASEYETARDSIVDVLQHFAPGEVAAPFREDAHPDHRFTHRLIFDAIARAQRDPLLLQYIVASAWSPWVLPFALRNMTIWKLDIGEVRFRKLEAISCYRSQFRPMSPYGYSALPRAYMDLFSGRGEMFVQSKPSP